MQEKWNRASWTEQIYGPWRWFMLHTYLNRSKNFKNKCSVDILCLGVFMRVEETVSITFKNIFNLTLFIWSSVLLWCLFLRLFFYFCWHVITTSCWNHCLDVFHVALKDFFCATLLRLMPCFDTSMNLNERFFWLGPCFPWGCSSR